MLLSLLLKFVLVASVTSCDMLWGCDSPSPPWYLPPPYIAPPPPPNWWTEHEAQVVALNSWAKLSTLGIIILALSHKCARFCCCPGAGRPWADDDDDDEDVEFDVEMTGKELTMAVTVSEKDGDHTSAVSIKGSV